MAATGFPAVEPLKTYADVLRAMRSSVLVPQLVDGELRLEPLPELLPHGRKWTRERLVEEARKLGRERGRPFSIHEFCAHLELSSATIYQLFPGKWPELMTEAGLEAVGRGLPRQWTDEALLDEYARAYDLLGRHPTYDELNRLTAACSATFKTRFGRKRDLEATHDSRRSTE